MPDLEVVSGPRYPAIQCGRIQPRDTPVITTPSSITTAADATGIQRKKGLPPLLDRQQVFGVNHQNADRHQHQRQAQAERNQQEQSEADAPQRNRGE